MRSWVHQALAVARRVRDTADVPDLVEDGPPYVLEVAAAASD
jgi:hypothetical protein